MPFDGLDHDWDRRNRQACKRLPGKGGGDAVDQSPGLILVKITHQRDLQVISGVSPLMEFPKDCHVSIANAVTGARSISGIGMAVEQTAEDLDFDPVCRLCFAGFQVADQAGFDTCECLGSKGGPCHHRGKQCHRPVAQGQAGVAAEANECLIVGDFQRFACGQCIELLR
ncbi:hypothetical protein D3C79_849730 [compost metagenome]